MFDWRFNPLLINAENFRQQIDNLIADYLSQNGTSDVTDSTNLSKMLHGATS